MSDKLIPETLRSHLKSLHGFIIAPIRECENIKASGWTHNSVMQDERRRRRVGELADSRTAVCLFGYSTATAYKLIPARMTETADFSKLDEFLAFTSLNNDDILATLDETHKAGDIETLADFLEEAIKLYASTVDHVKVERRGGANHPYMVEVEG